MRRLITATAGALLAALTGGASGEKLFPQGEIA
jgi:hypothetical protein